jgi:hypothetical protein
MSKELDAAIEHLTTTYQSLAQAATGYLETLDAKEINTRLAKAKPDTAEYVALQHLSALMKTPIVESAPAAEQPAE